MDHVSRFAKAPETLNFFHQHGTPIDYPKGQIIVRFEDTPQGIFYLKSGQVVASTCHSDGVDQILGVFDQGMIFGKIGSLMPQLPTVIHFQALTNCSLIRVPCDQFNAALTTNKSVAADYTSQVATNNVYFANHLINLGERNIYRRLVSSLILLSYYYGEFDGQSTVLHLSLTQEQIANLLCVTRETLNKTLNLLKHKNLVDRSLHQISIPSLSALTQELK